MKGFIPKWNIQFGREQMSYVLCSEKKCIFYMSQMQEYSIQVKNLSENLLFFFFFPSNQQLKKKHPKVKMDVSFWIEILHIYFSQQHHWRVILPHSGYCYYSAFTPYWNLRYRTIQEHVVILLSNNYCAVFVVHFWSVFDITSMPWQKDLI